MATSTAIGYFGDLRRFKQNSIRRSAEPGRNYVLLDLILRKEFAASRNAVFRRIFAFSNFRIVAVLIIQHDERTERQIVHLCMKKN